MLKKTLLQLPLLLAATASPVFAQEPRPIMQKQLSLDLANALANATLQSCRKAGFRIAVSVVDRAGQARAMLRDDLSQPHTEDTAFRKAYSALIFGRTTSETNKLLADNPSASTANLKHVTHVLLAGGGVPVRSGDEVIGAIGVSGARGGDKDEACAYDALKALEANLK